MRAGNFSRRHGLLVAAILEGLRVEEAAQRAGISPATAFRWAKTAEVKAALDEGRREVIGRAAFSLQARLQDAVGTLQRNLNCGSDPTEVRAAVALIDSAFRSAQLLDMEERLATLEKRLEKHP